MLIGVGLVDSREGGGKVLESDLAVYSWDDNGGDGVLSPIVSTGDVVRSRTYFFFPGGLTGVVWVENTGVRF